MHRTKTFGSTHLIWEQKSKLDDVRERVSSLLRLRVSPTNQSTGPIEVLRSISKSIIDNGGSDFKEGEKNWVVSGNLEKISRQLRKRDFEVPTLLGPNIEFEKYSKLLAQFKRCYLLVPAAWVTPILEARLNIPKEKIKIWAAGIDTEHWKPRNGIANKVLIYRKHDTSQEIDVVTDYLNSAGVRYIILNYGSYSQNRFRKLLSESVAAIWLCGTESQGIAMMQAWSMGVPTLVRRRSHFKDEVTGGNFDASSAPYLTELTGSFSVTDRLTANDVKNFLNGLEKYEPRRYVLENFTLAGQLVEAHNLFHELLS